MPKIRHAKKSPHKKATIDVRKTDTDAIIDAAQKANNVPQLRESVSNLAKLVKNIIDSREADNEIY